MTRVVRVNLRVNLGERGYGIEIEPGSLADAGLRVTRALGENARNAVLITNRTIYSLHGKLVERSFSKAGLRTFPVLIGDGERFKTLKTASSIYTHLVKNRIERADVVVGLGGGVVGDLAGFVAATYLRGLRLVHIPTTLLAQIDSSIGGKTGVNHPLGKNLIGAFHQPSLVLIDPEVIRSLPPRELSSGLFEAIKYGVISDKNLFKWIVKNTGHLLKARPAELTHLIAACCRIKANVVGQDERESGLRRILNFGHTVGHALEAATNYSRFRHGEAVAYGMMAAGRIGEMVCGFSGEQRKRLEEAVWGLGQLPNTGSIAPRDIISAMRLDKKVSSGRLVFVLPVQIGRVVIRDDVPLKTVNSAIRSVLI